MARSSVTVVRRQVYENLGITDIGTSYGTLKTNQRYPTGYIDDKIIEADIEIVSFLFKNKQLNLLQELYATQALASTGLTVSQNWIVVEITIDGATGVELPYGKFNLIDSGVIFDTDTYKGYYAQKNSKIYFIGTAGSVTYIDLTHPNTLATLKTPSGFDDCVANLASAKLLMKRADKPEQAKWYLEQARNFLQQYAVPDTNMQEVIND